MGTRLGISLAASLAALVFAPPAHASFPGANGRIAFSGDGDGDFEIYTMAPDGSDRVQVTHNEFDGFSVVSDTGPKWSPDGTKLLFTSTTFSASFPPGSATYIVNPDGTGQQRVIGDASDKGWSPDGNRIVFTIGVSCGGPRGECFENDAFVTDVGGSGSAISLGRTPDVDERGVDWGPRGDVIAISGVRSFDDGEDVWTVNADGSGDTRLLATGPADDRAPSWSPDGTMIAFVSNRDGNHEIYVMNADGTGQARLTDNPAADGNPVWSPDGTMIAFDRRECDASRRCAANILTMNADGTNKVPLTSNTLDTGTDDAGPDWQSIPGPRPSAFKNRSHFCKAERDFLGGNGFSGKYGSHGKCVSRKG